MKRVRSITLGFAMFALLAAPALRASLISGPDIISAPAYALDDNVTNTHMQAFDEAQSVTLTRDILADGGIVIPQGTVVDSHMIFLNTPDNNVTRDTETWGFDGQILGVMSDRNGNLEAASTDLLGAAGTDYPPPGAGSYSGFSARGMESGDAYAIGTGGDTITVRMTVTEPGDWIRVVTLTPGGGSGSPVPEPATVLLFGLGALGAGAFGARRGRSRRAG